MGHQHSIRGHDALHRLSKHATGLSITDRLEYGRTKLFSRIKALGEFHVSATKFSRIALRTALVLAITGACSSRDAGADSGSPKLVLTNLSGKQTIAEPSQRHGGVAKSKVGKGAKAVWLFTPESPKPKSAPVVAFLHGFGATDPYDYGGWIDHLVRRGNIVVYPVYQETGRDDMEDVREALVYGLRDALASLTESGPVTPDLEKFAVVGHSVGGGLSTQFANLAKANQLPTPRAIMAVQPGAQKNPTSVETIRSIPPTSYILAVEAENDQFKDTREGYKIFSEAQQIPRDRRAYVLISDGGKDLITDHYAPFSPVEEYQLEEKSAGQERRAKFVKNLFGIRKGEIDAIDRDVFWPLFDALLEQAFRDGSMWTALKNAGVTNLPPEGSSTPLAIELSMKRQ